MLHLTSPAVASGGRIPERHTCDGRNEELPLVWGGVPAGAKSLALVCSDPDAPRGTFHHWAVYDIPPDAIGLPARGAHEAVNDFGQPGYGGPCPPRGHGPHHYHFRLYALDVPTLSLGPRTRCADVEQAARRHAIAEADLVALYSR
ncbi:YbhB/YbcL family Raf kinase inhibitor-like protein [Azospirillum sp.]|uniref:YbhB/YbcL family Raf kinase inhibitor-like protein n=1 Tax=Azospirillum sp. TaxID=34012 RepID=UPI003D741774